MMDSNIQEAIDACITVRMELEAFREEFPGIKPLNRMGMAQSIADAVSHKSPDDAEPVIRYDPDIAIAMTHCFEEAARKGGTPADALLDAPIEVKQAYAQDPSYIHHTNLAAQQHGKGVSFCMGGLDDIASAREKLTTMADAHPEAELKIQSLKEPATAAGLLTHMDTMQGFLEEQLLGLATGSVTPETTNRAIFATSFPRIVAREVDAFMEKAPGPHSQAVLNERAARQQNPGNQLG